MQYPISNVSHHAENNITVCSKRVFAKGNTVVIISVIMQSYTSTSFRLYSHSLNEDNTQLLPTALA